MPGGLEEPTSAERASGTGSQVEPLLVTLFGLPTIMNPMVVLLTTVCLYGMASGSTKEMISHALALTIPFVRKDSLISPYEIHENAQFDAIL